jgi:tetratricopeptide (TPR) repeat protein
MSLLIKALDNAEKNKQAEKSKKQAAERIVESSLSLELTPLESKSITGSDPLAEGAIKQSAEKPTNEQVDNANVLSVADAPVDGGLSLEEEAGLNASPMAVQKYAKSKPEKNTASEQSTTLKDNLEESRTTVEPKATSTVPMPTAPIFQPRPAAIEANQKAAAKVFVANQAAKSPSSKYALVLLGVAGALMIWLGMQGYGYIKTLLAPDVVIVKPAMPLPPVAVATEPQDESTALPQDMPVATNEGIAVTEELNAANDDQNISNQAVDKSTAAGAKETTPGVEVQSSNNMVVAENEPPKTTRNKRARNNDDTALADNESSVKREPLKLTSKVASSGVDPTLLAAYQAFNRGEYALAQQQYRQVLQRDVRNVDALLGMAAIAQRQGRDADAAGWFQKVLEIEPRNQIAQSAMMNTQAGTDIVGTESRIKSMLAQQPESANLHAALGNLYAEQNRWALAQEAYFNASRFAPNNADYAFNLAISLDQLGKPSLALKQYQRALDLLNQSGASSPDRVLLEARIQALQ